MRANLRLGPPMLLLALLLILLLASSGCAQGDRLSAADTVQMLKDAGARGHLVITTGGSPLSAGQKLVFFLGPEDASLSFDGDVDFGKAPD